MSETTARLAFDDRVGECGDEVTVTSDIGELVFMIVAIDKLSDGWLYTLEMRC